MAHSRTRGTIGIDDKHDAFESLLQQADRAGDQALNGTLDRDDLREIIVQLGAALRSVLAAADDVKTGRDILESRLRRQWPNASEFLQQSDGNYGDDQHRQAIR